MANSEPIAVIGAGLMGHGIAQVFVSRGHPVALFDLTNEILSRAVENIRSNLTLMARSGIGSADSIEPSIQRIRVSRDLRSGGRGFRKWSKESMERCRGDLLAHLIRWNRDPGKG